MLDVYGRRVFALSQGEASGEPPLLILHGFPTSSHDFAASLPMLSARRRVVLLDFPGFGLSEKNPKDSFSLVEQAEAAVEVWRQLGVTHGHLLAHDYGTSVATELLARRERRLLPIAFDSVTLCNGSMHIELAKVSLTQKILLHRRAGPWMARLGSRRFFGSRMRKIFGQPDAVSDAAIDEMWAAIQHDDGHLRLPAISQYLHERTHHWQRWIGALQRLDLPVHVVWGQRDPIAVPAIAEQLAIEIPQAQLSWLPELGHYPMLENPCTWSATVNGFLEQ